MAANTILQTDNILKTLLVYFIGCITVLPCALWVIVTSANFFDCSAVVNHLDVSMLAKDIIPSAIGSAMVGSGWARDLNVRNSSFRNTEPGSLAAWKRVAESSMKTGIWETDGTSIVIQGVQR